MQFTKEGSLEIISDRSEYDSDSNQSSLSSIKTAEDPEEQESMFNRSKNTFQQGVFSGMNTPRIPGSVQIALSTDQNEQSQIQEKLAQFESDSISSRSDEDSLSEDDANKIKIQDSNRGDPNVKVDEKRRL